MVNRDIGAITITCGRSHFNKTFNYRDIDLINGIDPGRIDIATLADILMNSIFNVFSSNSYEVEVSNISEILIDHSIHGLTTVGSILLTGDDDNVVLGANTNIGPLLDIGFHFAIPFSGLITIEGNR